MKRLSAYQKLKEENKMLREFAKQNPGKYLIFCQRKYNSEMSRITELLAMSPKPPYTTQGQ